MITVIPRKIAATSVNGVAVANDGSITLPVDNTPTTNSTNLVTSGGVKTELDALSARIGNAENPAQVWTDVSFTIPTSSWSLSNNKYTTTVQSSSILATSGVFVNYDSLDAATAPITAEESTGQVTFTTNTIPTGTITGTFRIVDSVNGIVPIARGGTGTDNLTDARTALGAVAKTGDTMSGRLIFESGTNYSGGITVFGDSSAPKISFLNTGTRLTIDEYASGSTGGERYLMPVPEVRDADVWYSVLTSKAPVTIAQGGTGATTAAVALTNLGAVNKAGDTITGDLVLTKSSNYPSLLFKRYTNPDDGPQQMIQTNETGTYSYMVFLQRINADSAWEGFRLPSTTEALTSGNVNYSILTSKTFNPGEDFSSKVTFHVSVANVQFYRIGNVCIISYQSASQSHSKGEQLFTLPSGYRPTKQVFAPFTVYGTSFGMLQILTSGVASIGEISNDPATGRIYSNICYFV